MCPKLRPYDTTLNIQLFFSFTRLTTAIALAASLYFPCSALAISIGEIESESNLGEPLYFLVALYGGADENITSSCLSLIPPDKDDEDKHFYLTAAKLSVKTKLGQQYVIIGSYELFNEAFAKLRLRIQCSGMGSVTKTLTFLPGLNTTLLPTSTATLGTVIGTDSVAMVSVSAGDSSEKGNSPTIHPAVTEDAFPNQTTTRRNHSRTSIRVVNSTPVTATARNLSIDVASLLSLGPGSTGGNVIKLQQALVDAGYLTRADYETGPGTYGNKTKAAVAAWQSTFIAKKQNAPGLTTRPMRNQQSVAEHSTGKTQSRQSGFMLQLSSEPFDESRSWKITSKERALLLAQQKMLDADDQTAGFLTLQNQVKQLQGELGDVKNKLTQLTASALAATVSIANSDESLIPSLNAKQKRVLPFFGLALAIFALLFWLRHYNRINSQRLGAQSWQLSAGVSVATLDPAASPKPVQPPVKQTKPVTTHASQLPAASPYVGNTVNIQRVATPAHTKSQEELADVDSIIEEAELYVMYGHPERTVLMLQELILKHPNKNEAWLLLLSTLSALKKSVEFEQAAGDFLRLNNNSASLEYVKSLRCSLESDNSFAPSSAPSIAPIKRRSIGSILVETGMLSMDDMKRCLDDFDHNRDGRLGEYLVSRNVITEEQLQELLQPQRSSDTADETLQSVNAGTADISFAPFLVPSIAPRKYRLIGEIMVETGMLSMDDMKRCLDDFDRNRDGRLGEYLVSRNVITEEQLQEVLQLQHSHDNR